MKIDLQKLKKCDTITLIQEINKANEELSNQMHPPSGARTTDLLTYRNAIIDEIKLRQEVN